MKWHDTYEEYRKAVDAGEEREKDKTKGLAQTCWPPANAAELNLERWYVRSRRMPAPALPCDQRSV